MSLKSHSGVSIVGPVWAAFLLVGLPTPSVAVLHPASLSSVRFVSCRIASGSVEPVHLVIQVLLKGQVQG